MKKMRLLFGEMMLVMIYYWNLVFRAKKQGPVILAGGLNPYNVYTAIHRVRPYGVDVCSGVEQSAGKKDPVKVEEFMRSIRKFLQDSTAE